MISLFILKNLVKATRIPENFPLTDEMIDWVKKSLPELRLVECWANVTTRQGERVDWLLNRKKGMRLALKRQLSDEAKEKNGSDQVHHGNYPAKRSNADICNSDGYYN